MDCEIMCSLIIGVISGVCSSFIVWIMLNILFVPKISTDDLIQYKGKNKEFIRIFNKSNFNVYTVICRIEYLFPNGHRYYRTDQTMPFLKRKDGWYKVALNGSAETNRFFENAKGQILLVITYQNRFGIKSTTKPICIKCNK